LAGPRNVKPYIARRGSPHSMGAAVDLTLIDSDGVELDMGKSQLSSSPACTVLSIAFQSAVRFAC
jgi:D-alanyl-D-alanine dipeptidase